MHIIKNKPKEPTKAQIVRECAVRILKESGGRMTIFRLVGKVLGDLNPKKKMQNEKVSRTDLVILSLFHSREMTIYGKTIVLENNNIIDLKQRATEKMKRFAAEKDIDPKTLKMFKKMLQK